jgi:hypothetical protein
MKSKIIKFFGQSKNYALVIGIICFAIGIFGFVFKSENSISSPLLLLFIVLGIWGILVGVREKI